VDVQKPSTSWKLGAAPQPYACSASVTFSLIFAKGALVIHVRHASRDPVSRFRPDHPVMRSGTSSDTRAPWSSNTVNSCLSAPSEARLLESDIKYVVIVGQLQITASRRLRDGEPGFNAKLVRDAT